MSLGVAALALTATSGAIQAGSTYQQGQIENQVAGVNARAEENASIQANMESIEQQRRQRQRDRSFRGSQIAAIGASGAVGSTGSPLEILAETAARQELAIQDDARAAATARDRGFASATMTRWQGKQARRAANIGAFGQVLSTAGSFYGQLDEYKYRGVVKTKK